MNTNLWRELGQPKAYCLFSISNLEKKKIPIYIVLEVNISVGEVVCFRSDSLHLKYYGINFVSILQFKKITLG